MAWPWSKWLEIKHEVAAFPGVSVVIVTYFSQLQSRVQTTRENAKVCSVVVNQSRCYPCPMITFSLNISSSAFDLQLIDFAWWQAANLRVQQTYCCLQPVLLFCGKCSLMLCFKQPSLLHDIMTCSTQIHGGEQSEFGCNTVSVVLVKGETLYWTNPEAGEVWIGGIVGLVVSFHQGGDDPGLLLIQTWPHCLPGCLLLFPLYYHVLLPLDFLVCQDDCNIDRKRGYVKYLAIHRWKNSPAHTRNYFPTSYIDFFIKMACSHDGTNVQNLYFGLMFFDMFESIKKGLHYGKYH